MSESALELVKRLVDGLVDGTSTYDGLVAELGTLAERHEENAVVTGDEDAPFDRANVVARGGTQLTHVTLDLREPLPLDALRRAYGKPRKLAGEDGKPDDLLYPVRGRRHPYDGAVLAQVGPDGASTRRVSVRRDDKA